MIAPSTRHLPWLLAVAAVLSIPFLRGGFETRRVDDCARPTALLDRSALPGEGPKTERYERYSEDLRQWTVVELPSPRPGMQLRGAVIRSFRPIGLYSRPPSLLLGQVEAGERHVEWVEAGGDRLPIQTFYDSRARRSTMASYLFVYRNEPVEHPVWEQLISAPDQVWNGTNPLTLLIAGGEVRPQDHEWARERAREWLVAAYERHRAVCDPGRASD